MKISVETMAEHGECQVLLNGKELLYCQDADDEAGTATTALCEDGSIAYGNPREARSDYPPAMLANEEFVTATIRAPGLIEIRKVEA